MDKDEYVQLVKKLRAVIDSGAYDACPCPKKKCEWHGRCRECVLIHRYNGDHVPNCLQPILVEKIKALAGTAELLVERKPMTPGEMWDYVRAVAPRDGAGHDEP